MLFAYMQRNNWLKILREFAYDEYNRCNAPAIKEIDGKLKMYMK